MTSKAKASARESASRSTSPQHAPRSWRDSLASAPTGEVEALLDGLSENALRALPWLFEHWALEHQLPPEGDWTTWVILGGRGAGKTRAGAEWIRARVEGAKPGDPGECSRIALVAATLDEAREVMVFGESGLLAVTPPDRRPDWQATRRRLVWPNGAVAQCFSAASPDGLRGPQFDCAWSDEIAKWEKGAEAWDMLQFGLRLGARPRQVVTTTPRGTPFLKALLAEPGVVVTRAATRANRMNLARSFLEAVSRKYAGSRLGRQELEGELVEDLDGALWSWEMLSAARTRPAVVAERVVVAVDPPATGGAGSDECGIIVASVEMSGAPHEWRAEILCDGSVRAASPQAWAERAAGLYRDWGADRLVAEVNQGGDMVEQVIRSADPSVRFRGVRATRGKAVRAEPVAALYEQGRIRHRRAFPELEAQMAAMTVGGYRGRGSPDRLDALVWALFDLMIVPAGRGAPRVRGL